MESSSRMDKGIRSATSAIRMLRFWLFRGPPHAVTEKNAVNLSSSARIEGVAVCCSVAFRNVGSGAAYSRLSRVHFSCRRCGTCYRITATCYRHVILHPPSESKRLRYAIGRGALSACRDAAAQLDRSIGDVYIKIRASHLSVIAQGVFDLTFERSDTGERAHQWNRNGAEVGAGWVRIPGDTT